MRREWIPVLACPSCRAPFDLDPLREDDGEVLEAFLVCRRCRDVRPILGGVPSLPPDLVAHLRGHGHVYRRSPIGDPRLVRFLLGVAGDGVDAVPFDEVVARYGDLAPDASGRLAEEDAALDALLAARSPGRGRGLDVGTGVGRGAFVLAAHLGDALGLDRSLARVRRARNLATTTEPFLVPRPAGSLPKEVPLDLSRLERDGCAFAVGDAHALPVPDASFDVVVLRAGDGMGPWERPDAALAEAKRALRPGGLLVTNRDLRRGSA